MHLPVDDSGDGGIELGGGEDLELPWLPPVVEVAWLDRRRVLAVTRFQRPPLCGDHLLDIALVHRSHALDTPPLIDAPRVEQVTTWQAPNESPSLRRLEADAARRRAVGTDTHFSTLAQRPGR